MTGKRAAPPPGSRKVPGLRLWMTEDGTPYGPYGKLAIRKEKAPTVSATRDDGRGCSASVAQSVAKTWLPPKPPNSKLVHLDGDNANNRASNLAWVANLTAEEKITRWRRKVLSEMNADATDRRHGTRTGYTVGCRCWKCMNAMRLLRRMDATRHLIREIEEML